MVPQPQHSQRATAPMKATLAVPVTAILLHSWVLPAISIRAAKPANEVPGSVKRLRTLTNAIQTNRCGDMGRSRSRQQAHAE